MIVESVTACLAKRDELLAVQRQRMGTPSSN